jgi:DNA-directed RNA polymerase specialized sigma24 family protein
MPDSESVTRYFVRLQQGDEDAAQKLWELYFRRLVGLARQKLAALPRRAVDEEDVALSAFDSFCRGAEERGRFPNLRDRHDLWRLLVTITARKALDQIAYDNALKHGGGRMQGESGVAGPDGEAGFDQLLGREPNPAFAAEVAEEYRRLLERLGNDELRSIALWKMEGYTNEEIAAKLGCVPRTVERKLAVIRGLWQEETAP